MRLDQTADQFRELIKSKPTMRVTALLALSWMAAQPSWLVISLSAGELAGSIFLNIALTGFVDALANIFVVTIVPYFRRQVLLSFGYLSDFENLLDEN